ncbi:MAG: SAP domain-containing protein [Clostridiales bacterium]|nr:SAP domain-containing protein [Clostridiales bacterium]
MSERPELNKNLSGAELRRWYWLKEELTDFCRENGLPASGSKTEIADRIAVFLDTGKVETLTRTKRTIKRNVENITPGHTLDEAIRCWKYKKSQPGSNEYEDSDLSSASE